MGNQKKTPTAVKRPTQIEPKLLPKNRSEPAVSHWIQWYKIVYILVLSFILSAGKIFLWENHQT